MLSLYKRIHTELGVALKELDLGGGFGIPYMEYEEALDVAKLALQFLYRSGALHAGDVHTAHGRRTRNLALISNNVPWFEDTTLAEGTTGGTRFALGRANDLALFAPQDVAKPHQSGVVDQEAAAVALGLCKVIQRVVLAAIARVDRDCVTLGESAAV